MRAKDVEMPSERKVRTRVLASRFTCKICNKLIKDSTAIADCLHSFCEKCIYKKVYEEKCHNCPVCNVEINGSLLRPDATMRSLKVSLLGVHRRTPEQRAESKRMKLEKMNASHDQAKKPESTKKLVIAQKDKGKEIVIDKPLEDQRITTQSTKKPVITHKEKGKGIVIDKPLENKRISSQSTEKPRLTYKDKGKAKVVYESHEDEEYDLWGPVQGKPRSQKGIVIRSSPPRSPPRPPPPPPPPPLPPPVDENEMTISSKSKGKRPTHEIIPMDYEKMAVTETTTSGSKSKEPKRRVGQKRVATPSSGIMISPQDVIDAGKNINPAKTTHCAWFIISPSKQQNNGKKPLRRLLEPNLRLTFELNTQPTVSILKKYIARKLKLDSWEKVGMFMFGNLLSPEMKLVDVENEWMELVGSERQTVNIGSSAYEFCIHLTYAST